MKSAELDILIKKVASGDMDALESIYNMTREQVYSYAMSILKNPTEAEDVLHDCYIRIYHGASGYSSQGKPLAWIFTITRNLCLRILNESSKRVDITEEEWERKLDSYDKLTTEEKAIMKDCLLKLTEEEQQIITLHALSGYKHREIAETLGKPLSTVLSRYNRALSKLREM